MIRAKYVGMMLGVDDKPYCELWTIFDCAGHYLPGSTLSRRTIEQYGTLLDVTNLPCGT